MDHVSFRAFQEELTQLPMKKTALLERLIRLGATDIAKTPRMFMKQRNAVELAKLQLGVAQAWNKKITAPIMRSVQPALMKIPEGKPRQWATVGAHLVAEDPFGFVATRAILVPGASAAWVGMKKGLERAIDRFAPLANVAAIAR